MSFDCSRFPFDHWKDYAGVVMQQGRVQLDSDWNEWLAILMRRLQAGTMDTLDASGDRAVYPSTTPYAFQIGVGTSVDPTAVTIGYGRIYVDGLLVENHPNFPAQTWAWDPGLAELSGSPQPPPKAAPEGLALDEQPYFPNMPKLPADKTALFYLDVWQRPVTWLEDRDLIEIAVGVDTTARLQTAWQVKWLAVDKSVTCSSEIDEYVQATRPSGARLSSDVVPSAASGPCCLAPNTGYTGLENQLYRVEIHQSGPFNKDTSVASIDGPSFKWSRDNASVMTAVTAIEPTLLMLTVESIGRDDVLCFKPNDWIEVTDDLRELAGQPGDLRQIAVDGVDKVNRTITLTQKLTDDLRENLQTPPATYPNCHSRVCRWDQAGKVRRSDDNSVWFDLDGSNGLGGIPLPGPGVSLILENGVTVSFNLDPASAAFSSADFWNFAARAADGQIEKLKAAPPMGPHHHYARLALVPLPAGPATDCRIAWPPAGAGGADCNCDVCIELATFHGSADIVTAAEKLSGRGGGRICFGPGLFVLDKPVQLSGIQNVTLCGHGTSTRLHYEGSGAAIAIEQCALLLIHDLAIEASMPASQAGAGGNESEPLVGLLLGNCAGVTLERCGISAIAPAGAAQAPVEVAGNADNETIFSVEKATKGEPVNLPVPAIQTRFTSASTVALAPLRSIAVALSGFAVEVDIHDSALVADLGIGKLEVLAGLAGFATLEVKQNPLLILQGFTARENFIACTAAGIALGEWTENEGACFHLLETAIENNHVLAGFVGIYVEGITYPGATVRINANQVETGAYGILSRLDAATITDNTVTQLDLRWLLSGGTAATTGAGIVVFDSTALSTLLFDVRVLRNRIVGVAAGPGIVFDAHAATITIADNTIQSVIGAGITVGESAFAVDLVVRGNDILQVTGPTLPNAPGVYGIGAWLALNATIRDNAVGFIDIAADVARDATGILIFNVGNASVGNNQVSDVGTLDKTPIAIGIASVTVQSSLNLSGNTIRATSAPKANGRPFVGLMALAEKPTNIPVSLQDNYVEAASSNPLVIVGGTSECVFSANRCWLEGGKSDLPSKFGIVYIQAMSAVVGNNRIQGAQDTGLFINVPDVPNKKIPAMTVLGNIVSGSILYGATAKPLAPPWMDLNVNT
jgi:hypothetical protein